MMSLDVSVCLISHAVRLPATYLGRSAEPLMSYIHMAEDFLAVPITLAQICTVASALQLTRGIPLILSCLQAH